MNKSSVEPQKTSKIFISYRRADSRGSAGRLSSWLKQTYGRDAVFLDVEDIRPGIKWEDRLKEAILGCSLMLVIIGPKWLEILQERISKENSTNPPELDRVRIEILTALQARIEIIPVCLDHTKMPEEDKLDFCPDISALGGLQKIDLISHQWRPGIEQIMQAIEQTTDLERLYDKPLDVWDITSYNSIFSGRDDIITQVGRNLQSGRSVALCGLPGVGKTEIAREYARQYGTKYSIVLWANAATEQKLTEEFRRLAKLLKIEVQMDWGLKSLIEAAREYLELQRNWLMILDEVEDVQLVEGLCSEWTKGHLLLTSTSRRIIDVAEERLMINPMEVQEGALLLLRRSGILSIDNSLRDAKDSDKRAAAAISDRVGGLPMALDQAGAFIQQRGCTLDRYLSIYKTEGKRLRAENLAQGIRRRHEPVTITFSLSFKRLEELQQNAGISGGTPDLLRLCAFLAPDAIPEELLVGGAVEFGVILAPLLTSEFELEKLIGEACQFSLMSRDAEQKLLHIHRQVQDVIKDQMSDQAKSEWAACVVRGVNNCLPDPSDVNSITDFHRVWSHAAVSAELMKQENIELDSLESSSRTYTLNDFIDDLQVQDALGKGNSWDKLLGDNVNYSTMYTAMHNLEGQAMQRKMRRVIVSLRRILTDPRQARLVFCCMYFVTHYWWDIYLKDDNLCPPLLEMWLNSNLTGQVEMDEELATALDTIQADYPPVRNYRNRENKRDEWTRVRQAIETLREIFNFSQELPDIDTLSSSERYVWAMTNVYLAEASRYAPCTELWNEDSLWQLYKKSELLLRRNEDLFHESWVHCEYAEALRESGYNYFMKSDRIAAAHSFQESVRQSSLAIQGALTDAYQRTDDEGGGYYIDSELIANSYRVRADILWIKNETRPNAWFYYCAAVFGAYAFMLSEGDSYAREFYAEQRERAIKRLMSMNLDARGEVVEFLQDFWMPHWQSFPSHLQVDGPFPPVPSLQEIQKPGHDSSPTEYRNILGRVLSVMHERVSQLKGASVLYKRPARFLQVLKHLQNIPRFLPSGP